MLWIAEELEHIRLAIAYMTFERFQNRFGREPLVNEQRQSRNFKGEPFSFAGPVQKRPAHRFQFAQRFVRVIEVFSNNTKYGFACETWVISYYLLNVRL